MKSENIFKIISDSFGPKAESIEEESFHLSFENRPTILAKMKESKHHFLIGRRGTGKTTFLKYLDLATLTSGFSQDKNIPAIGFYINFDKFAIPNLNILSSDLASAIFSKWFLYKCVFTVIDGIESAIKKGFFLSEEQLLNDIVRVSIEEENKKTSFSEYNKNISEILQSLEYLCCKQDFNLNEVENFIKYPLKKIPFDSFLNKISKVIRNNLIEEFKDLPGIFFLFDRFDELPSYLQEVTKGIIHWGPSQEYYLKIGISRIENIHIKDIPHRDYRIINIEFPDSNLGEQNFSNFSLSVLHKRMNAISTFINRKDAKEPISSALVNLNKLLPPTEYKELPPIYCGIKTIQKLSSRNISIFLDFIFAILREAIINPNECDVLKSSGIIPFDLQNKAIREEASTKYTQEFPSQVSSHARKLFKFLINCTHPKKGPQYKHFTLEGDLESDENKDIYADLNELEFYYLRFISHLVGESLNDFQ